MDANYEAQKQLGRQRQAALLEQAATERTLRTGRPPRGAGLRVFLARLFRRPVSRSRQQEGVAKPALAGPGKR